MTKAAWSMLVAIWMFAPGCAPHASREDAQMDVRISAVNAPSDIVTVGAHYLAREIAGNTGNRIRAKVFHSGVLSGGKGEAEIEMCQQGAIEIHVTSTAYLANLVPRTSVFSLPFLFRDMDQVAGFVKSRSAVLDSINAELNRKNLHVIAWWPRGFRQLTNNRILVRDIEEMKGLKLRVMNNPLYADNMRAMSAHPVPMAWGEVYNALQLGTIDGQENAEDVIYNSRLFEAQKFMTVWDYSIDLEVVLVNRSWWQNLRPEDRAVIAKVADASVSFEEDLLRKNTVLLRKKIADEGMRIHYIDDEEKARFREAVQPVWNKYTGVFGEPFLRAFLAEVEKY